MNKKQNGSAILAGIAITAILVASSLIAGNQFTQQAHAQANSTSTSTASRPAGPQEPRAGATVNWQGTVSSNPSPLAGHKEDIAVVLPLRKDGGLYTGVITFAASKGVSVQVWNLLSGVSPAQPIGKSFGKLSISPLAVNGKFVATSDVGSADTSGSVPFAGNALALVGKSPFIATYSVTAQATTGKVTNNLTSATALAAAAGGAQTALGGGGAAGALSLGGSSSGGKSSSGGGAAGVLGGSGGGGSSRSSDTNSPSSP